MRDAAPRAKHGVGCLHSPSNLFLHSGPNQIHYESNQIKSNPIAAQVEDFFDVRFVFLPNFEERTEDFVKEVADLSKRFKDRAAPDALCAPEPCAAVPGDGFVLSVRSLWQSVSENKDLDLPAHKVMVATIRCSEIAAAALEAAERGAEWAAVAAEAGKSPVGMMGRKVQGIVDGAVAVRCARCTALGHLV